MAYKVWLYCKLSLLQTILAYLKLLLQNTLRIVWDWRFEGKSFVCVGLLLCKVCLQTNVLDFFLIIVMQNVEVIRLAWPVD